VLEFEDLVLELLQLLQEVVGVLPVLALQRLVLLGDEVEAGVGHDHLSLQLLDDLVLVFDELLVQEQLALQLLDGALELPGGQGQLPELLLLVFHIAEGGLHFAEHLEF
jgi:hypothetical protein